MSSRPRIYVGNVPYSITEPELRGLFAAHGDVVQVTIVTDRDTGKVRGFAFVEMADTAGAEAAQAALDGAQFGGRTLHVNPAADRAPHERGGNRGRPSNDRGSDRGDDGGRGRDRDRGGRRDRRDR